MLPTGVWCRERGSLLQFQRHETVATRMAGITHRPVIWLEAIPLIQFPCMRHGFQCFQVA